LPVSDYYEPAWEPIEVNKVARHNQESCYLGDDFGGHNYPFPHPRPPTPDKYYVDSFIDITAYYHNGIRVEPKVAAPAVQEAAPAKPVEADKVVAEVEKEEAAEVPLQGNLRRRQNNLRFRPRRQAATGEGFGSGFEAFDSERDFDAFRSY